MTEQQGAEALAYLYDLQQMGNATGQLLATTLHWVGACLLALLVVVFFLVWRVRGSS